MGYICNDNSEIFRIVQLTLFLKTVSLEKVVLGDSSKPPRHPQRLVCEVSFFNSVAISRTTNAAFKSDG